MSAPVWLRPRPRMEALIGFLLLALVVVALADGRNEGTGATVADAPRWMAAPAPTDPVVGQRASTQQANVARATVTTGVPAITATTSPPTTLGVVPLAPTPTVVPPRPLPTTVSRVNTTDRVVFLTIDDGYVRDPAVVDQIRQAHIPVSLFLVGSAAKTGTPYFNNLLALGANVEDHTLTHPTLKGMSLTAQMNEICGSATLDHQLFGAAPTLFRPPYGTYDSNTAQAAARCGFPTMILWQATVNDGVLRIQGRDHLMPGDIILMHFRTDLSVNLQVVLNQAAADGLKVARLEDYL